VIDDTGAHLTSSASDDDVAQGAVDKGPRGKAQDPAIDNVHLTSNARSERAINVHLDHDLTQVDNGQVVSPSVTGKY